MVIKFVIDVDKFCEILWTTHFVLQGLCYQVRALKCHLWTSCRQQNLLQRKVHAVSLQPQRRNLSGMNHPKWSKPQKIHFFIFSRTFGFHPNWFVENPPLMFFSKQSPSNTSASSGEYSLSLFLSFFVFVSSFLFVFCVESVLVFIQHKRFFRWTLNILFMWG